MSKKYQNAIIILNGNQFFVTARSDDRDAEAIRKASEYGYNNMSTVKELDRIIAEDQVSIEVIKLPGQFTKEEANSKKRAIIETLKATRFSVINGGYFRKYQAYVTDKEVA